MDFATLKQDAFNDLVKQTVEEIKNRQGFKKRDKWICGDEVMAVLRIKSETALQKLRETRKIRFIQPGQKIILYDADSLDSSLENTPKKSYDGNGR